MASGSNQLSALLIGGTGATGKEVLKELSKNELISKIFFISRRAVQFPDHPKVVVKEIDFDNLEQHKEAFAEGDIAFCCLGTTKGKSGAEGFVKVDYDYVVNTAKLLKDNGACKDYHLVSSKGASAGSFFLYPSTKGKAENAIKEMEFPGRTSIYRPGLLITENFSREGDSRLLERWGQSFAAKFDTSSKQSISVGMLATSMVANALDKSNDKKFEVIDNSEIVQIGKASTSS